MSTPERWQDLAGFDVIVATPNAISPGFTGVATPPTDFFDLILVDEAHHTPARTWSAVLDAFPQAKAVLATATPFRLDQQPLDGRFVYTYSMRDAVRDGLYSKIQFKPVSEKVDGSWDVAIAKRASEQLLEDVEAGWDHRLLIRTDQRSRARELKSIYDAQTPLRVEILDAETRLIDAQIILRKLADGDLDGVIAVNVLGEGFDFPRFKVAAVHAPHRSLPVTLQFIGRFARTSAQVGDATFIAAPVEIVGETQRLFEEGAVWQELLPDLATERLDREVSSRERVETFTMVDSDVADIELSLLTLRPALHSRVFTSSECDLDAEVELPSGARLIGRFKSVALSTLAIVYMSSHRPQWSRADSLVDIEHTLIVACWLANERLLFVAHSASNPQELNALADALTGSEGTAVSSSTIGRAFLDLEQVEFFNVGLRKRMAMKWKEAYRIMSGPAVHQAIGPTEGLMFQRGHVMGRGKVGTKTEYLGLSSTGKVWSVGAATIVDFVDWCSRIGKRLARQEVVRTGTAVDQLTVSEQVTELPARVLWADWSTDFYFDPPTICFVDENGVLEEFSIFDCDLSVAACDVSASTTIIALHSPAADAKITATLLSGRTTWSVAPSSGSKLYIASGDESFDLAAILQTSPLVMYTEGFGTLIDNEFDRFSISGADLFPDKYIVVPDWSGVDIREEIPVANAAVVSIHDFVRGRLAAEGIGVVIADHGKGEMADFIRLTEGSRGLVLELYHCKKLSGANPGGGVTELYEVCGQAIKSFRWVIPTVTAAHLNRRLESRPGGTSFIRGTADELSALLLLGRKDVEIRVKVVHPGMSRAALLPDARALLGTARDFLSTSVGAASLELWCSP